MVSSARRTILFELIGDDFEANSLMARGGVVSLLGRCSIVSNGDLTIRTEEQFRMAVKPGKGTMAYVQRHMERKGLAFLGPEQSVVEVIAEQFPTITEAPVSYITMVVPVTTPGYVYCLNEAETQKLRAAGVLTVGDLGRAKPEIIAEALGNHVAPNSSIVRCKFAALENFYKLMNI